MAALHSAACVRSVLMSSGRMFTQKCRLRFPNSLANINSSSTNHALEPLFGYSNALAFRKFYSHDNHGSILYNNVRGMYKCSPYLGLSKIRSYSSNKSTEGSTQKPSITQEILEARTTAIKNDSEAGVNEPVTKSGTTGTGSESNQEKPKGWWRVMFSKENAWKVGLVFLGGCGAIIGLEILFFWGRPEIDENGAMIEDEFSHLPKWQAYPRRAMRQIRFYKKMIQEPSSQKLLPDPLKEPYYQPPYTLVLEMTGVLVHPDWTIGTGWRFKKRPGVDYFLQQVGPPLFEIVIYTHEQGFTAFPIIDGLDPHGHIMYRLFRDATRYLNGTHVKDLECLNRDLSKVIIVDCDQKAFSLNPQNAFLLKKWSGDDRDRTLIDLAAFLRLIATSGIEDVRSVLEYYSQFDDPLAVFREKQQQLQEQQDMARATADQQSKQGLTGRWSFGLRGRNS